VYLSACSFGKKVRNLSNNVDIRKALRSTIRSELISDTNLRNAVSWSEVFKFSKLKSDLKIAQIDLEISDTNDTLSEEQILHSAANILRRDIQS
jgi:hypothetical protein